MHYALPLAKQWVPLKSTELLTCLKAHRCLCSFSNQGSGIKFSKTPIQLKSLHVALQRHWGHLVTVVVFQILPQILSQKPQRPLKCSGKYKISLPKTLMNSRNHQWKMIWTLASSWTICGQDQRISTFHKKPRRTSDRQVTWCSKGVSE